MSSPWLLPAAVNSRSCFGVAEGGCQRGRSCLDPLQATTEMCRISAIGTLSLSFLLSYKEIGQEAKNQDLGRKTRSYSEKVFLLDWK